jgi:membrane-bound ClpP family serine protease
VSTSSGAEGRELLQECTGNTLLDALYRENPQFATLVKEMGEPPVRRHFAAVELTTASLICFLVSIGHSGLVLGLFEWALIHFSIVFRLLHRLELPGDKMQ